QQRVLALVALASHDEGLDEALPQRRSAVDGDVAGGAQLGSARLDVGAFLGIDAAGVGEDGVHGPAPLAQPGNAEAGVEAAGEGEDDGFVGHVRFLVSPLPSRERGNSVPYFPSNAAITAFCTCRRFSASSMAMQLGESMTASVALTFRRSGRQWLKTASLVSAILASSTMKWRWASRMGFSSSQRPKYGMAPQLLA